VETATPEPGATSDEWFDGSPASAFGPRETRIPTDGPGGRGASAASSDQASWPAARTSAFVQRSPAAERADPEPVSLAALFAAAGSNASSGGTSVSLQREPDDAPAPAPEPAPAPAPASAPPAAAAPAATGTTAAPAAAPATDLDEMARRLFEPLSARLKAELWLDRERAGTLTDVRP
jgi:hypothetical protein